MIVALVTDADNPLLTEDDTLLAQYLTARGYKIVVVIWDDEAVDWTVFDTVIVRSAWDYFHKIEAFNSWLHKLEQNKIKTFNPVSVLRWNQHKSYLLRFQKNGVSIPPFVYCIKKDNVSLADLLKTAGWAKAVIKPTVSAGAYQTWVIEQDKVSAHQAAFEDLLSRQDVIVQKFCHEIIDQGEVSLIYFNKKFSHGVIKKAKPGDFRVQAEHGGHHSMYTPQADLIRYADSILDLIVEPLLYARIDGFMDITGKFHLMEIELLEPSLFFDSDPYACQQFEIALSRLGSAASAFSG